MDVKSVLKEGGRHAVTVPQYERRLVTFYLEREARKNIVG